jgi:hypothetical protein
MKKLLTALLTVLPLLLLPLDSWADKDKAPSDRAYDRASDNASFKRDNDKKKHKNKDKQDDRDHKDKKKKNDDRDDDDRKDKDKNKKKKGDQNE